MNNKFNKIIINFLMLFLIVGCNQDYKNIENQINTELEKTGVNSKVLVKNIKKELFVDVSFSEPYNIFDIEHQNVLISYIVFKMNSYFIDYDNINFKIYLDKEVKFNSRIIEYDRIKLSENFNHYSNNPLLLKLIEFSINNIHSNDVTALNIDLKFMNQKFPNHTVNSSFFKVIKDYSIEANQNIIGNNSKSLLLIYFFKKDVLNKASGEYKKDAEIEVKIISDLWRISRNRNIDFENRILSEIRGNGSE